MPLFFHNRSVRKNEIFQKAILCSVSWF
uniref:Uncharacterized protein n=1 Tax=Rhizophora mucronata TaxID=61149 RepID=A0A2P2P329_RHIMU